MNDRIGRFQPSFQTIETEELTEDAVLRVPKTTLKLDDLLEGLIKLRKAISFMVTTDCSERT